MKNIDNLEFDKSLFKNKKSKNKQLKNKKNNTKKINYYNKLNKVFANNDELENIEFIFKDNSKMLDELKHIKDNIKQEIIELTKLEFFGDDVVIKKSSNNKLKETKEFKKFFKIQLNKILTEETIKITKIVSNTLYKNYSIYPIVFHKTCATCIYGLFEYDRDHIGFCKLASAESKDNILPVTRLNLNKYKLFADKVWVKINKYTSCNKYSVNVRAYFKLLEKLLIPTKDN